MIAVVFANGELNKSGEMLSVLKTAGLIIAADGGAQHCLELGVIPQVVIGDLDSLTETDLENLTGKGTSIIRHPSRKDYTDLELALQYALQSSPDEIIVLGALGKRWDQTLANLLLPAGDKFSQATIRLVDGPQEIHLIRPGKILEVKGRAGDIVSLIPLWGDASGVTTEGLEYPLEDGLLKFASTRGVSNVLIGESAKIQLSQGLLACVVIHD